MSEVPRVVGHLQGFRFGLGGDWGEGGGEAGSTHAWRLQRKRKREKERERESVATAPRTRQAQV